ncbi:MAG TPA: helix-turn-helix domain-containing protein [Jatrophihabitantaceae bacterium]|nr:helix-turn-helix domain-containing protein [Jatrophihabitantaceae bacterium]
MTALPRGRHNLPRETVVASQRERILRAATDMMSEQGYASTSVADILRSAGVSRETFYEQFDSKQDCFVAALEAAIGSLQSAMQASNPAQGTPLERFGVALATYLDAIAADTARARLFLVEVYAVDEAVMRRRVELQQGFADRMVADLGVRSQADRFACTALVAAISSLVTARVIENDVEGIHALRAPILALAKRLFG